MAGKSKASVGDRFGRWAVLERMSAAGVTPIVWRVRCRCGVEKLLKAHVLIQGKSKSCGCYRRDFHLAHGENTRQGKTKLYRVWDNMMQRCQNAKNTQFKNYGGRGIAVSPRWKAFTLFVEDMGADWFPRATLDRIDNNGDYAPDNCRWVTRAENLRNKRNNVLLTHSGKTQCLQAWADERGIAFATLRARLKYGWTVERALTEPVRG